MRFAFHIQVPPTTMDDLSGDGTFLEHTRGPYLSSSASPWPTDYRPASQQVAIQLPATSCLPSLRRIGWPVSELHRRPRVRCPGQQRPGKARWYLAAAIQLFATPAVSRYDGARAKRAVTSSPSDYRATDIGIAICRSRLKASQGPEPRLISPSIFGDLDHLADYLSSSEVLRHSRRRCWRYDWRQCRYKTRRRRPCYFQRLSVSPVDAASTLVPVAASRSQAWSRSRNNLAVS